MRLTQTELARKLDLQRSTYANYELDISVPTPNTLKRMAALGLDPGAPTTPAASNEPWQIRATPRQIRLMIDLLHNIDAPAELRDTARLELLYALGLNP
jgi:transcriptional regulator with XRE-family HTH domain